VVLSALWHDNFGAAAYIQRICVVGAVSALAVVAARGRARVHRDRERFSLLASIAEIADGTRNLEDTVGRLNDLVVPLVADVCIVDAVSQGQLTRLAVHAADGMPADIRAGLAARPPSTADHPGDTERPRLVASIDDA